MKEQNITGIWDTVRRYSIVTVVPEREERMGMKQYLWRKRPRIFLKLLKTLTSQVPEVKQIPGKINHQYISEI